MVTKLKNSNCDKIQQLKLWHNSKCRKKSNCEKIKIVAKLKNSNCDNVKIKTEKKTQTSNCDKTFIIKVSIYEKDFFKGSLRKNFFWILTTNEMFSGQHLAILAMFYFVGHDVWATRKYILFCTYFIATLYCTWPT